MVLAQLTIGSDVQTVEVLSTQTRGDGTRWCLVRYEYADAPREAHFPEWRLNTLPDDDNDEGDD
jgi:hypothetical protein